MNILTTRGRRIGGGVRWAALLVAAAVLAAPLAGTVRADTTSKALAKYEQPVDQSIDRALAWLAKEQHADDGSWVGEDRANLTGITSLCVMAFLAKGHTPGVGPYGEVLNKGIDFILSSQRPNGLLDQGQRGNGAMYCHSISTLMLSEVSGMVDPARQQRIDTALGKALKAILAAQRVRKQRDGDIGGWRYQLDSTESDISCTGWAVMALRSARNNGAAVPKEAIDMAMAYIMRCRCSDDGFAYQVGGTSGWARTGTAVLCLELCGHHRERPALLGGEWILKHLPKGYGGAGGEFFSYAMYYCAQATFQLGDEYWEKFAPRMYDIFLAAQDKQGFWPPTESNRSYSTAMTVLAMSVPYCQLPIYQR